MSAFQQTSLHRPGTRGYRRLNWAVGLAGLAAFGMLYAAQPLLPQLSADFGVSPGEASLGVSASTGALALTVVPVTALALRFGRGPAMRAGLLLAVVLTALTAVAPTFGVLVVLRAAAGVALAAVIGVAMGHVGAEVHPSGLGAAMGLYVAGNSVGGVAGRVLGSAVVDASSWRWAMAVLALAALVATAGFWRWLPASVTADRVVLEGHAARPHAFRRLLTDPSVVAVLVIPFALMGGFVAAYNYLTYRLAGAPFDLPSAVVGLVFLSYLGGSAASAVAGRLADAVGRPRVLVVAIAAMSCGLVMTIPDQLGLVIAGVVVFTIGFFAAHATASGWAPVVAGRHGTQASALYVCAYYAGSSVFGAVLGISWHEHGWSGVVLGVAALTLLALAATCVVTWRVGNQTANARPDFRSRSCRPRCRRRDRRAPSPPRGS